ncbi:hypothetical protein ABZP36_006055 [Zizania latifolia]
MLTLPRCNTSSPTSSPRVKDCIDLSPEEADISGIRKTGRKESAKERKQYDEDSGSVACGTSEVLDDKTDQESHSMKQETTQDVEGIFADDITHVEDIAKPDCSETICSGHATTTEKCRCNSSLVCSRKYLVIKFAFSVDHKKMCELHQDMMNPHSPDAISDQQVFWEDEDATARVAYIKAVLELSELCTYQNIEVWYLEDELISPCLVEELHQDNPTDDLKLLFDCICEAITVIEETYFINPPCLSFVRHKIQAPPMGQNLIPEINKYIERHLYNQFQSTLHQLVSMDMKDDTWMNLRSESGEIAVNIWDFILDELLEDVASDLFI